VKILFWGSPDFSLPSLEGLLENGYDIVAVVTREDKQSGRGRRIRTTSVKSLALERGLNILQPARASDPDFMNSVSTLSPDISVIAAYGKILKEDILYLPPLGSICIHPSLLPLYRGASPVQRAILAGDTKTGVTIFQMDKGMDSGEILIQKGTEIGKSENAGDLSARLSHLSCEVLLELLPLLEMGEVQPEPQDDSKVTLAPKIEVEEARIDWTSEPRTLELESKAFDPWPGPFSFLGGERIRLFSIVEIPEHPGPVGRPGEVVGVEDDGPVVIAGSGFVRIREFQSAGKKRMDAASWMRGRRIEKGALFGQQA
jgi:methionyl-tRNA formyltransferase